jgi:hypothetical protein
VSILQLFSTGEYYEPRSRYPFQVGQLCRLVVPHIDEVPKILAVERSSPTEHEQINFEVRAANPGRDFRASPRVLPLKHLNLGSKEELLVQNAKRRPGVIVSTGMDADSKVAVLLRQKGKKHLQQDSHFVVPCYSIQEDEFGTGFPPQMIVRVQCLIYRQFFYLPANQEMKQGIVRFDRIQVVHGQNLAAIEPFSVGLAGEFLTLFLGMFLFCLSGREDDDLQAFRAIAREAYTS